MTIAIQAVHLNAKSYFSFNTLDFHRFKVDWPLILLVVVGRYTIVDSYRTMCFHACRSGRPCLDECHLDLNSPKTSNLTTLHIRIALVCHFWSICRELFFIHASKHVLWRAQPTFKSLDMFFDNKSRYEAWIFDESLWCDFLQQWAQFHSKLSQESLTKDPRHDELCQMIPNACLFYYQTIYWFLISMYIYMYVYMYVSC